MLAHLLIDRYARSLAWFLNPLVRRLVPRHRFGRPPAVVERFGRIRTVASFVVAVAASLVYPSVEAFHGALGSPLVNFGLAVPALLVAGAVMVVAVGPGDRRRLTRSLAGPVGMAAAVAACYGGWMVLTFGLLRRPLGPLYEDVNPLLLLLVTVPFMIAIGLYVVPAALLGGYLAGRHWFATADAHPMLPALCATAFGMAQLGRFAVEGFDPSRPWWVTLALGVGGPAGLIGLAAVELRLVRRTGVSLRSLPAARQR